MKLCHGGPIHLSEITKRQFLKYKIPLDSCPFWTTQAKGFTHLSLITGIDRLNEEKFEVVYRVFCWESGETILVSTLVDRKTPVLPTIMEIWPVARFYERDVHEFFGIVFDGNPDLKPVILEKERDTANEKRTSTPINTLRSIFRNRNTAPIFCRKGCEDE
jgi:NADH-quinone oxidoreductase subunit C